MKKLTIFATLALLSACHNSSSNTNSNITIDGDNLAAMEDPNAAVDENLAADVTNDDENTVAEDDTPKDMCKRPVQSDTDGNYYTVNPDGSWTPGVIEGDYDAKKCKDLIKSNNGGIIMRVAPNTDDSTDGTGDAIPQ